MSASTLTGIKQVSAGGSDGDAELYTLLARRGYLGNRLAVQETDSLGAWLRVQWAG